MQGAGLGFRTDSYTTRQLRANRQKALLQQQAKTQKTIVHDGIGLTLENLRRSTVARAANKIVDGNGQESNARDRLPRTSSTVQTVSQSAGLLSFGVVLVVAFLADLELMGLHAVSRQGELTFTIADLNALVSPDHAMPS
jgi:hypothetical protein